MTAVFGSTESDRTRPSRAEIARTVVASAGAGCLTTYPRAPAVRPHHTKVVLEPDVGGLPILRLDPCSSATSQLLARPVATLRVAPAGRSAVLLHGSAHRLPARGGCARYRVEVALDCRGGLDVLSVDDHGVQLVRLPFPEPVNNLRDLSTGLAAPLLCRCQRDASTQVGD